MNDFDDLIAEAEADDAPPPTEARPRQGPPSGTKRVRFGGVGAAIVGAADTVPAPSDMRSIAAKACHAKPDPLGSFLSVHNSLGDNGRHKVRHSTQPAVRIRRGWARCSIRR
jgi:hypothetical protein